MSEPDLRVLIANSVADGARPEYRGDVRARMVTIATGAGTVHGRTYVLRNWGLDESRGHVANRTYCVPEP